MLLKFAQIGLIYLSFFTSFCSLAAQAHEEIYLIPQDYEGAVILLYNQPDGIKPEVDNDAYVYKIPRDGILKIQGRENARITKRSYFYLSQTGERKHLEYLYPRGSGTTLSGEMRKSFDNISQEENENVVFVMSHELGNFNTKKGPVYFTNFIVGKPKNGEDLYDKMQRRITSIQRGLI